MEDTRMSLANIIAEMLMPQSNNPNQWMPQLQQTNLPSSAGDWGNEVNMGPLERDVYGQAQGNPMYYWQQPQQPQGLLGSLALMSRMKQNRLPLLMGLLGG
jgi:hypothetical protein